MFTCTTQLVAELHALLVSLQAFGSKCAVCVRRDEIVWSCPDLTTICTLTTPASMFSDYRFEPDGTDGAAGDEGAEIIFSIDIGDLLPCLTSTSALQMTFDASLEITLEDELIVEKAQIPTYIPMEIPNYALDVEAQNDASLICEVNIRGEIINDIIRDLKLVHCDKFVLYMKPSFAGGNSKLIFISQSKYASLGVSKLIVQTNRRNVPQMGVFKAGLPVDSSVSSCYLFEPFRKIGRCLQLSRLVRMRKFSNGVTALTMLMEGHATVEFTTLETVNWQDRAASDGYDVDSSLGYDDSMVEELILKDEEVNVIKVGTDGQLTLDDFYSAMQQPPPALRQQRPREMYSATAHVPTPRQTEDEHDDVIPNSQGSDDDRLFIPELTQHMRAPDEANDPDETILTYHSQNHGDLKLTKELAQSLLGGLPLVSAKTRSGSPVAAAAAPQPPPRPPKKKPVKRQRRPNNGILTIGGADEVPLHI